MSLIPCDFLIVLVDLFLIFFCVFFINFNFMQMLSDLIFKLGDLILKRVDFLLIFFDNLLFLLFLLIKILVKFLLMWHVHLFELFLKLKIFVFKACSAIFYFIKLLLLSWMEVVAHLIVVYLYCTILFVDNFHLILQLSILPPQLFILHLNRLLLLLNFVKIFIKFL